MWCFSEKNREAGKRRIPRPFALRRRGVGLRGGFFRGTSSQASVRSIPHLEKIKNLLLSMHWVYNGLDEKEKVRKEKEQIC